MTEQVYGHVNFDALRSVTSKLSMKEKEKAEVIPLDKARKVEGEE